MAAWKEVSASTTRGSFSASARRYPNGARTPELAGALGDREAVEQALGNLVDNALRHGAGTVTLAARSGDGRVSLLVRDEGAGFPAEFLPDAFERFSRVDPSHAGAAAGLGLAIVRAIAIAHGGTATASGAEVCIELPSARTRTDDDHRRGSPAGAGG